MHQSVLMGMVNDPEHYGDQSQANAKWWDTTIFPVMVPVVLRTKAQTP